MRAGNPRAAWGDDCRGRSGLCGLGHDRRESRELKRSLHDELAAIPPRNPNAPVYLPIDRAFALPGLGTIVTGTLMQGTIEVGETLALEPGGRLAHVRSIGVFESTRKRVEAGSRVALNVPGIDRREISRGQAIVGREFCARQSYAVRVLPLENGVGLLRRRTPVRAYIGSAEILGTLVTDGGPAEGSEIRALLHLREPVVAFPGVRFILRRPSPMTLLGGGYVEGVDHGPSADARSGDEEAVLAILRTKGLQAVELSAIAFEANLREDAARNTLDALIDREEVIRVVRPPAYVEGDTARALLSAMRERLEEAHRTEPWAMGMTSIALSRALGVAETTLVRVAEHFLVDGRLLNRGGYYATVEHRPSFTPEQRAFFDGILPIDTAQPLLPASFTGAASAVKLSPLAGVSKAFDTMLALGTLVKVGDDLYRGQQIARIRARVEAYLREHNRMTAAEFRDLLGTSRKYAVPLLEWLDSHGVTIRDGDYRTLRQPKSSVQQRALTTTVEIV